MTHAGADAPRAGGIGAKALVLAALLVLALVTMLIYRRELAAALPAFARWIQQSGPLGPVVFIGAYAVAAVVFFPAVLLTLSGGALFGLVRGTLYVMAGATLGAALAFLAGRYVARGPVERLLQRSPKLAAIDAAVGERGAQLVFLLRLSPAVPYVLLNYALGISRVRFGDYLLGTLGMLPVVAAYVYSGKVAGELVLLAGGAREAPSAANGWLLGLGLVATVVATVYITRVAHRAVENAVQGRPREGGSTRA